MDFDILQNFVLSFLNKIWCDKYFFYLSQESYKPFYVITYHKNWYIDIYKHRSIANSRFIIAIFIKLDKMKIQKIYNF